ncbi:MAG TPA: type II toxin-antitoxin system VapC family toxin [Chthonomonadaceae bacterium]|nr:type II toxin-antitoxin system VapC family toxin [Chthonomonadaceae bacterium]
MGTSGLSKRYIAENGSGWLRSLIDPSTGNEVYIVRLTAVEIIAAITRRERGGSLLASDAAIARTDFRVDLATGSVPLQSG